jgi:hypothetical protein
MGADRTYANAYRPRATRTKLGGPAYISSERPTHRVIRDRLAEQHFDSRVNMRRPHRPAMIDEHPDDRIVDPSRPTSGLSLRRVRSSPRARAG